MKRPLFITFEGSEGAGKTTQVELLRAYLVHLDRDVLVTRQPGGDPVGMNLRKIMLDLGRETVHPRAELMMMMADRAQSVETVIRPHLERGGIVICDRYADSSVAYQGGGRGLDIAQIHHLNHLSTAGLLPDCTFLLDIAPEIGLRRQKHKTKMEMEDLPFHRRVREQYLSLARSDPHRIHVVSASDSIGAIHSQIVSIVDGCLI